MVVTNLRIYTDPGHGWLRVPIGDERTRHAHQQRLADSPEGAVFMTLDRDALDRYITSSRYSEELCVVVCSECEGKTDVKVMTEYGMSDWDPGACTASAGLTVTSGVEFEPPEPDYEQERWDEYGQYEPWV